MRRWSFVCLKSQTKMEFVSCSLVRFCPSLTLCVPREDEDEAGDLRLALKSSWHKHLPQSGLSGQQGSALSTSLVASGSFNGDSMRPLLARTCTSISIKGSHSSTQQRILSTPRQPLFLFVRPGQTHSSSHYTSCTQYTLRSHRASLR